jgi:hypothetical protein
MDAQFLKDRQLAVKTIAGLQEKITSAFNDIEELADQYGIRVSVDLPFATGYNGDAWYVPHPPIEMQEDTVDENFDPAGTDWQWEQSAEEHTYDDNGAFGWKNSSSNC